MQVTPSGKRPCPTPPTPNAPDLESARFANRDTVVLPDEVVTIILMNLGTTDIAVCRSVNRHWQTLIDTHHLLARSFYRDCHLTQRINSPAAQRNLAVERYHSHIRGWLTDFSNSGRETAKQLDDIVKDKHFPSVLFFSIPKLLLNSNELTYQNTATTGHFGVVRDASFGPDGKHLVLLTVPYGDRVHSTELLELVDGKLHEKASIRHSAWVTSASLSLDGNHLVTASFNGIAKLWRLEDDQWQEEDTIQHSRSVKDASFSPDGKYLVTVSYGDSAKIWWFVDGKWQEKASIEHSQRAITNAQFSLDGKHLVTASDDGTVKIWKLDDGQWEEKFTTKRPNCVTNARLSPDGKHLVMVTSGDLIHSAELWELVDGKWQENATIEHSNVVNNVHFSLDGKHLVTASHDATVKICRPVNGKWQENATIRHSGPVTNANFSRNGKLLVTASYDATAKICGLVGGNWQEIVTIGHSEAVTNASFGPDYQIVTASYDGTAKVWVLKENDDNS